MPGGNLREGQVEYLIRTLNEFATVEEIAALIVARQGDADVYLRDIGDVVRSHKDREIVTRVNGRESVEVEGCGNRGEAGTRARHAPARDQPVFLQRTV